MRMANAASVLFVISSSALELRGADPDRILPTVVSAPAQGGGTWRTMLVAHNPSEAPSRFDLTFHPAGTPAGEGDPTVSISLAAGESITVDDVLLDRFGLSTGSGSLDVADVEGEPAVLNARVTRDAKGGGHLGLSVPVVAPAQAITGGERAVLLVPSSPGLHVNVGARTTGATPATLDIVVRDARGITRSTSKRTIDAGTFLQLPASEFVAAPVSSGDTLVFDVVSGSLFLYGTPVDDVSGDGSYESAQRVSPAAFLTSDFTPPTGRDGDAEGGPGVSRLMTATSTDGLTFTRTGGVVTDQGDVPDLLVDSRGWVYLYYVGWKVGAERNKVVVAISRDKGKSWVYKKVVIAGFEGLGDPVDPDVQLVEGGVFRVYVTGAEGGDFMKARTYYAEGTDGIHFTKKGVAFAPAGGIALDPSTARIGGTWHLFSGGSPGSNHHATSSDGKSFAFDREMTFPKDGIGQLMANGIAVPGGTRFYTFDAIPPPGKQRGINSVFTPDGTTWTVESGSRLAPDASSTKESLGVKDPAAVRLSDGTYLMVYSTRIP